MTPTPTLLLVGCGHMGGGMLRQWLTAETFAEILVVKPSPLDPALMATSILRWVATPAAIPADTRPDIVMLAVRPKDLAAVAPAYTAYTDSLFISLAAGKKIGQLEALLGSQHAILRAMPNVASEVGSGMTFITANDRVSPARKNLGEQILKPVGAVAWLDDEGLFDAATTLSGCGPGYVFALVEAMAEAGVKLGLPAGFAMTLARQTVIGSGALLAHNPASAHDLRLAIGNPGTMTAAALAELMATNNGLSDLMLRAMTAAMTRAHELAA